MGKTFLFKEFGRRAGDRELYSWVGKESEIEFLKVMDNAVIPVEVKSGQRIKAKSLLVYNNNYPLYLAGKIK